jgi:hypothetical protein
MKLFGKYQEYSINDIHLYSTPTYVLKQIILEHPDIEKIVKEHKPRIFKKTDERYTKIMHPDYHSRHRVVLVNKMGAIKISMCSIPLNHKDVKNLGLKPIPNVKKKEKIEESLTKLGGEKAQNRRFHVEQIRNTEKK